jgi:hypothetical protein
MPFMTGAQVNVERAQDRDPAARHYRLTAGCQSVTGKTAGEHRRCDDRNSDKAQLVAEKAANLTRVDSSWQA